MEDSLYEILIVDEPETDVPPDAWNLSNFICMPTLSSVRSDGLPKTAVRTISRRSFGLLHTNAAQKYGTVQKPCTTFISRKAGSLPHRRLRVGPMSHPSRKHGICYKLSASRQTSTQPLVPSTTLRSSFLRESIAYPPIYGQFQAYRNFYANVRYQCHHFLPNFLAERNPDNADESEQINTDSRLLSINMFQKIVLRH